MERYKKPVIASDNLSKAAFPFYAAVGAMMALKKGRTTIDSTHTQALTSRKKTHD